MHILHTVSYTFPRVLTRRTCWSIKGIFSWWSFPLLSWPYCVMQGLYCWEKLDAGHSQGLEVHERPSANRTRGQMRQFNLLTSATLSGPPSSSISSSKVFGGRHLDRTSSLSSNSLFIALHISAAEFASGPGLFAAVKLEKAGALAEWCKVFSPPADEGKCVITNYKIIQIVRALWLAIKPFYTSVCKGGLHSLM